MTIAAPTPVTGVRPVTVTEAPRAVAAQSIPERTLATWTYVGPAVALVAGVLLWPAALLVLAIPASVLLTAGRDSMVVREHAVAALNFVLTTLVGLGLLLGAMSVLAASISPFVILPLIIGVLVYLGAFLTRAGVAASRGREPGFPLSLPILA
jgi:hypothetical protein